MKGRVSIVCKNLMIAGVKPGKQKELREFMVAMAPMMSRHDSDGFGYAAYTDEGIYGEHWLQNDEAFKYRQIWSKLDDKIKEEFKGALEGDPRYNMFETKKGVDWDKQSIFAMILHSRAATTEKILPNVHPFVRGTTALIHNGVIGNWKEKHLKTITSSCDSETILNSYIDRLVQKDMSNIDAVAQDLRGSYTCGVLTQDKDNKPIMDIFRNYNQLSAVYIRELDALVFSTNIYYVQEACRDLKWKCSSFFEVKDDNMIRIDAKTGRCLAIYEFKSITVSQNGKQYHNVWFKPEWDEWYKRNGIDRFGVPLELDGEVANALGDVAGGNMDDDTGTEGDATIINQENLPTVAQSFNDSGNELTDMEKKMKPKEIEISRRNGKSCSIEDSTIDISLPESYVH